ncbi:motility associated factor glycosyltransferase family protein [Planomicrobium okeanokoites]|uniref:motility associated factor glycosyltransferase family protein n=1 Tax=Planomicrobium okeanokoites TaxID=244 RepID=UPI0009FC3D5A|nr:6-hydroxymethylpterin diphosphokinase MptE-like protein [Planomicrobium okeanokoites]
MLIDNRDFLRLNQRPLLQKLENSEANRDVVIEPSKNGLPTLRMLVDERNQYIHSKYDPEKEAVKLINQINDIDESKHVLFIGAGLGYHIRQLLTKFPRLTYSVYEPNLTVLKQFFSNFNVNEFPKSNMKNIITSRESKKLNFEIERLLNNNETNIFVYALPSYSNLYVDETKWIMQGIVKKLKYKRNNLVVNASFQTRWTTNSIKNFPFVLQTPNVLTDVDKNAFEGKPAIIVAAGPSLNEEFENLRYIKENGLAYIFSVGSAINSLIENGIYPDAACTYDPSEKNQYVIQKVKDLNINEIPLIFGSSVGYETLINYPGEKLHMFTSQDSISPYLVNKSAEGNMVMDASSIAVVTFQLLSLMKCNVIVLVGQNLGYQNNKRYAKGIEYNFISNELSEKEAETAHKVKDVYGNYIDTTDGFDTMRKQLEIYISKFSGIQVINTSKGGAHIEGADFIPLEEVISSSLRTPVVEKEWYKATNDYKLETVESQFKKIEAEQKKFVRNLGITLSKLEQIKDAVRLKKINQIEQLIFNFEKSFNKIKANHFYSIFIEPVIRNSKMVLSEKNTNIRFEKDIIKKGRLVVEGHEAYLKECHAALEYILPSFHEMKIEVSASHEEN